MYTIAKKDGVTRDEKAFTGEVVMGELLVEIAVTSRQGGLDTLQYVKNHDSHSC